MSDLESSTLLKVTETLRVPFHDLDPGGVVWHGRYFKYFERARSSLFDSFGYNYNEMKMSGSLWPVVDTNVRFVRPLLFDQEFLVIACLKEWEVRLVVDYRIKDKQGVTYTRARTVQVPVNAETLELQFGSPEILIRNVEECIQALTSGN